ncbi:hypothetical protein Tco_1541406 [Tanacetum coccineum]
MNGIVASRVSATDEDCHAALVVVECDASKVMSTPVFVDPESSTQADGAQSSRVPVPLPEDPYEAIRQAYLDGETLSLTTRMAVRVPPAMSSGLSASIAEVAAMSESAFRKRFRSSYESSPSVSPPDLPSRKRYRGTSELVEDSEEDEEIEESLDSDSVGEDAEDKGSTAEDEDPAAGDEGLAAGVEGPGMDDESYGLDDESHGMDDKGRGLGDESHSVESDGLGLEEEEAVPGGQQQAALVVRIAVSAPLENWTGSSSRDAGGLIRDHAVRLEELSPALFERSLEYEQERVAVTFGAIWRPVLALESWAGQTDAQRAALWHAISDMQGENQDLRLQLIEERRARLELAEVVDSMRRGQEPRGGDILEERNRHYGLSRVSIRMMVDVHGDLIILLIVTAFPRMGRAGIVDQVSRVGWVTEDFANAIGDDLLLSRRGRERILTPD